MSIAAIVSRYLLGIVFLVFGLNGFLHFIPQGPMPTGPAGEFTHALLVTHYMAAVFAIQLIAALLLLAGRYVPLALALIAPVIANIDLVHLLMLPQGLPVAALVTVLWILLFIRYRWAFEGLLRQEQA